MRIVVAGATFGRVYAEGVRASRHDLVGIVGRGGADSQKLSHELGVPCFPPEEVPTDIDLACVVIRSGITGGAGSELARACISKGIHVVQEQPVHLREMIELMAAAKKAQVHYSVNAFYPYLRSVAALISATKQLRGHEPILLIEATTSLHVAYPFVNVLGRLAGGLKPFSLAYEGRLGGFERLSGTVSGVPVSVNLYNEMSYTDPDNYAPAFMQFRVYVPSGVLALNDVFGPLLWTPRLHVDRRDFEKNVEGGVEVLEPPAASHGEMLAQEWADGVKTMLDLFEAHAHEPARLQYQIAACTAWQNMTAQLPPAGTDVPSDVEPMGKGFYTGPASGLEL